MNELKYAIIETDSIYHEGDERSRTHPGHGYPAHTERITKIREYNDRCMWETHIKSEARRGREVRAIVFKEVDIVVEATVKIEDI